MRRDGSAGLRRWILVAVAALLGVGLAAFATPGRTSRYRASTWLFFSVSGASTIGDLAAGAKYTENLMPAFVAVATTAAVLDPVNRQLGLHMTDSKLATMVHPKAVIGTVMMYISADGSSPQQAAAIANAVGAQLSKSVAQLSPAVARSGAKQLSATVVAPAQLPRSALPTGGKKTLYIEGFFGGLLLGICLVRFIEGPANRVRNERDLLRVSDTPMLGRIHYMRSRPLLVRDTENDAGEAFRALRANVFAVGASRPRSIVITASWQGEGATTTAINLALVAAETGLRVLLVDTNLRHPSAAAYLKMPDAPGLIAALSNPGSFVDAVRQLPGYTVDVLPAGDAPTNPGKLVGSPEMTDLIAAIVAKYDLVVFDAPALLTSTDAAVLARHSEVVLVVVDTRKTKRRDLATATASLHHTGAPLLGVVLNKTSHRRGDRKSSVAPRGQPKVRRAGKPPAIRTV